MTEHFWLGVLVVLVSGTLNGSFPLPMKYARRWRWENTWLFFCALALLTFPWLLAAGFVPSLGEVYGGLSSRTLFYPIFFGFLWGIAQTTFGIGLKALGIAFAFAIVAGLGALFGSLAPLLLLNPQDLFRPRGILLLVSIPILILGLTLYAKAGRQRDQEQAAPGTSAAAAGSFAMGLAICIFTGIVGPSWNLGFAYSGELIRKSQELGAGSVTSVYPVWPLVLSAGFIPNLLYCVYLLARGHGWGLFFTAGWPRDAALALAMAVLWLSGIIVYGMGAPMLGAYGPSVGFALFVSAQILISNALGLLAGEWKGTSPATRRLIYVGIAVIIGAVAVLSLGGLY